jgi:hypothetical protein
MRVAPILLALIPTAAYGQAPGQGSVVVAAPPESLRAGLTFDAAFGFGFVHDGNADGFGGPETDGAIGVNLGIGAFVLPNLAITGRVAFEGFREKVLDERASSGFLGPTVQWWPDRHLWVRGGIGLSVATHTAEQNGGNGTAHGLGLDLGAGFTVAGRGRHAVEVGIDAEPGFYNGEAITAFMFVVGYQYL